MLSIVALILSVSLVSAAPQPEGYPTVQPSEFDCSTVADPTTDRFYPNPENCNQFYRCVPGHSLAYLYTCLVEEEVYDDSFQMCVNVWDSFPPCGTKQSTTTGTGVTNNPPTADPNAFLCDGKDYGYYPNPESCSSFYICNEDVIQGTSPSAIPCPPGLVYNPDAYYCDWTYNVAPPCGTKVTRQVVPYDENTAGPACADNERYDCAGAVSVVVDSNDCSRFYNCDANIQLVCPSTCPAGLVFDITLGLCNYSYAVSTC